MKDYNHQWEGNHVIIEQSSVDFDQRELRKLMTTIQRNAFPPYPRVFPLELNQLLEELRVRLVTAIYYECSPEYDMRPRRIGDDMFYYVAHGKGEVTIDDRTTPVRAGDAAHFARGVLHAARTEARDPFHIIALHYDATVFGSLTLAQLLRFPDVTHVGLQSAWNEMATIACREYALRPPGWQSGLEALVFRLLLNFIRDYLSPDEILEKAQWRETRRILPALEMMRRRLHGALAIGDLARSCHLSEPQFRRVFSRVMNTTPNAYLRRLRLEEAASLLRRTDETIDAIAARVGYADASFFAHSFKAVMGTSPGKYRIEPPV